MELPPEIAEQLAQLDADDKGFPIWAANKPIVDAFIAVARQWRAVPIAPGRVHWQGLDYASVDVGLKRAEIVLTAEQWTGVQIMEGAAASALNGYRD